jgi:hypothetical protein
VRASQRSRLAKANPAAYLPNLASALNNLGNRLNAVDQREEVEAAWAEAMSLNAEMKRLLPLWRRGACW